LDASRIYVETEGAAEWLVSNTVLKGETGAEYLPKALLIYEMACQREQYVDVLKRLPKLNQVVSSLFELSSGFLNFELI
jgi:hypothetical protein